MSQEEKKNEIDLMQYWGIIIKRKWVIITFVSATVLFTAIFTFLATPMYKASAILLIEEESSKMLRIDETLGFQTGIVQDMRFFNTQLELLKSKSLAERVAGRVNLSSPREPSASREQKKSLIGLAKDFITLKWVRSKKQQNDSTSEFAFQKSPYSGFALSIQRNLEVKPVQNTKLVEISYSSSNPVKAADIVNILAEEFRDFSLQKRTETTQRASDFLSDRIADLQDELTAKKQELQRYSKEKDLVVLSDGENAAVSSYAAMYGAYNQARIDRTNAEANWRGIKDLSVDTLPQVMSNSLIQQLRGEYARIHTEYNEKSKIFLPDYPEMVQLKARLDSTKNELEGELKKAIDTAETEYRTALNRERYFNRMLDNQMVDVSRVDSAGIRSRRLQIEVDSVQKLITSLIERRDETLVSANLGDLKTGNIAIIDRAEVPQIPYSPKKKLNLILALLIGLVGGTGLCLALEYLDNAVKGPDDVEKLVALPSLGVIPYLPTEEEKRKELTSSISSYTYSYGEKVSTEQTNPIEAKNIELINHLHPQLIISEDYKTVRTSILLSHQEASPKCIVFSSTLPQEGKTVTVANMAVSFSQLGKKVLIIDADLRRPRLHRIFKVRNTGGLSGHLAGKTALSDAILETFIPNIWLLPSGPIPPNPAELLESDKMKETLAEVKKRFDIILIDTPPVLAVIDTVIVSTLADGMVYVLKAGKTARKAFVSSIGELRQAKVKLIGIVFNGLKVRKSDYYFMNYYRYYRYKHYSDEN